MLCRTWCVLSLAVTVAVANDRVNIFIDDVLYDLRSHQLLENPVILPARKPIEVNGSKAKVSQLLVYGLNQVTRLGDCNYWISNRFSSVRTPFEAIQCNITLDSVRLEMDAEVTVRFLEGTDNISTRSTIASGNLALIEIQGEPDGPAILYRIRSLPTMHTELLEHNFNPEHLRHILEKINSEMSEGFLFALEVAFSEGIRRALDMRRMPLIP